MVAEVDDIAEPPDLAVQVERQVPQEQIHRARPALRAATRDVRRDDDARMCPERALGRQWLRHDDVEDGAADAAVVERAEQSVLVDESAPRDVHESRAGLQRAELRVAEEMSRRRVER